MNKHTYCKIDHFWCPRYLFFSWIQGIITIVSVLNNFYIANLMQNSCFDAFTMMSLAFFLLYSMSKKDSDTMGNAKHATALVGFTFSWMFIILCCQQIALYPWELITKWKLKTANSFYSIFLAAALSKMRRVGVQEVLDIRLSVLRTLVNPSLINDYVKKRYLCMFWTILLWGYQRPFR